MATPPPLRGRGATFNAKSSRFDDTAREDDGDWLDAREDIDGGPPPLRTTVTIEKPKTIVSYQRSPDIPFDRSINAYRGCEHGCIYCFARPTHAFHNLSPGLDFESKLFAKPSAADLLRAELMKRTYECRPIAMGTNTDPYQPIEQRWKITRQILEVLQEFNHPFTITTKSARVTRDLDILAPMAAMNLAAVMLSVTSLDPKIARTLEPRASAPHQRIRAIKALADAGVPVFVSISPVVPAITDHEIEAIVEAAAEAGARGAFSLMVRLPHEVAPIFRAWLDEHFPDRKAKVMALIREARGGKDNEGHYFARFRPQGAYAAMLRARFEKACRKHGLIHDRMTLDTSRFRRPGPEQLGLF
ncbi:PA0069 family radical SAM protein [Sphingoaurantiacus capsulatus]|uniref:PA0069 family radical SAM protein n=1 Tax=Sphingoaurantiacus capsulatus TaxID=1771310 RepID=A0ABV7XC02_9SPHN